MWAFCLTLPATAAEQVLIAAALLAARERRKRSVGSAFDNFLA